MELKLGHGTLTMAAGSTGMALVYQGDDKDEISEFIPMTEAVDLIAYLVQAVPVISTNTYALLMKDVEEFKGRETKNRKLNGLMERISHEHFNRSLTFLGVAEKALVRRAAEAEIALEEK